MHKILLRNISDIIVSRAMVIKPDKLSLLYISVRIFGLDRAQTKIDIEICWRN